MLPFATLRDVFLPSPTSQGYASFAWLGEARWFTEGAKGVGSGALRELRRMVGAVMMSKQCVLPLSPGVWR